MNCKSCSIRYWPTWLGLALLRCLAWLPWRWQLRTGRWLGHAALKLAQRRRQIAATNLALCFPGLDRAQQQQLLEAHFVSLGIGVMEFAMSWWAADHRLATLATIEGLEHLQSALARGRGVILLSAHFTTLEIGGRLLARHVPFHVLYREHKNPAFEQVMHAARTRHYRKAIPRSDLRGMLESLAANNAVWYAPDQDHGSEHSLFVPFFGVPAATIKATARLAGTSGAAVVPFFQQRLPGNQGYQLTLLPALEKFPGTDMQENLERINAVIESQVRQQPEQYLWVHRRFKTRPPGRLPVYTDSRKHGL